MMDLRGLGAMALRTPSSTHHLTKSYSTSRATSSTSPPTKTLDKGSSRTRLISRTTENQLINNLKICFSNSKLIPMITTTTAYLLTLIMKMKMTTKRQRSICIRTKGFSIIRATLLCPNWTCQTTWRQNTIGWCQKSMKTKMTVHRKFSKCMTNFFKMYWILKTTGIPCTATGSCHTTKKPWTTR